MPGEKVLEAQVRHEVPGRRGEAAVVLLAMARQSQRLRLVLPLQALDIEAPQVPFGAGDVRRIRVDVLHRQRRCGTQPLIIMVEHRLEPIAADIAIGRSVNGVAECHVVG